jgi:hypothetical protein
MWVIQDYDFPKGDLCIFEKSLGGNYISSNKQIRIPINVFVVIPKRTATIALNL